MTTTDRWRPVPGYRGYEVSMAGEVRSHVRRHPRILKPWRGSVLLGRGNHLTIRHIVRKAFES